MHKNNQGPGAVTVPIHTLTPEKYIFFFAADIEAHIDDEHDL